MEEGGHGNLDDGGVGDGEGVGRGGGTEEGGDVSGDVARAEEHEREASLSDVAAEADQAVLHHVDGPEWRPFTEQVRAGGQPLLPPPFGQDLYRALSEADVSRQRTRAGVVAVDLVGARACLRATLHGPSASCDGHR